VPVALRHRIETLLRTRVPEGNDDARHRADDTAAALAGR
jgi:hypothetical protein